MLFFQAKHGRNVSKISQTLKTKSEAEIQALIEAEHGVYLDTPTSGLEKYDGTGDTPAVIQEEIVTDDPISDVLNMVTTGSPTIPIVKQPLKKKNNKPKVNKKAELKSRSKVGLVKAVEPSEMFYEDDLTIGSTEIVSSDIVVQKSKNLALQQKAKIKALKKIGNHR